VPLAVELSGRSEPRRAFALNLSPGGIGLHLVDPPPVGETVVLRFAIPDGGPLIRARARVVWTEAPPREAAARFAEAGLRFEGLPAPERDRVHAFAVADRPPADG
jgi:hypothetical protein